MRNRILVAASVILALTGCEMENDMMIPKDVAGYESFEVEDQVSSSINTSKLTVTASKAYGVPRIRVETDCCQC